MAVQRLAILLLNLGEEKEEKASRIKVKEASSRGGEREGKRREPPSTFLFLPSSGREKKGKKGKKGNKQLPKVCRPKSRTL